MWKTRAKTYIRVHYPIITLTLLLLAACMDFHKNGHNIGIGTGVPILSLASQKNCVTLYACNGKE